MTVSISGTNGVTFPDSSLQAAAASPYVLKNRIINGDMRIDQRNAGAAVTTNLSFPVDRFFISNGTDGTFSAQQSTSIVPAGFTHSVGITITAADTSLGATQALTYAHRIEGYNIADLAWGTANAQTVTLSFWVRSSLTGTFGGSLRNSAANRSYPFTYTISLANTWEQKSVTIAGDTSGTWLTDSGIGILTVFALGAGVDRSGTAGAWNSNNNASATGATSVVGTNGATFYITGVQLEQNTSATPFERRLYNQELANCQRYYQKLGSFGGVNAALASGVNYNTTTCILYCKFTTTMRAAPTGSVTTVGNFNILSGGVQLTCTSLTPYTMGTDSTRIDTLVASGLTTGQAAVLYLNSTTDGIQLNAEL